MADILIEVQPREEKGKAVNRLRRGGFIPAIIYGGGKEGLSIKVNEKDFMNALKGHSIENLIVKLKLPDQKGKEGRPALIRQVQVDPLKDRVIHVDFQEVSLEKKLRMKVHVEHVGEPVGVAQEGGILECTLREIEIECLPMSIPEAISVDVSGLGIGHTLFVRDIKPVEGVTILTPADISVFSVAAPKAEEEVVKEGEVTEPEVIGKKKETEEGAAEAAAPGAEKAPAPGKPGEKKAPEAKEGEKKKEK